LRTKANQQVVFGIKGFDHLTAPLGNPSRVDVVHNKRRLKQALTIWPLGASYLKEELYRNLAKHPASDEELANGMRHPNGYCHFPKYSDEHFRGLTAEQCLTKKDKKGRIKREWVPVYRRNEPLDCRNYARAAAAHLGWDLAGQRPDRLARLAQKFGRRGVVVEIPPEPLDGDVAEEAPASPQPPPRSTATSHRGRPRVSRSSYMTRK
jgi:phage terminase large subunit GpA-like protein